MTAHPPPGREMTAAHLGAFLTVMAVPDPAGRASLATSQLEALTAARDEWVALRDLAIVEMRTQMTLTHVADDLGLTHQRIQQICARNAQHPGRAAQVVAATKRRARRLLG